jgi:hypothetical protein
MTLIGTPRSHVTPDSTPIWATYVQLYPPPLAPPMTSIMTDLLISNVFSLHKLLPSLSAGPVRPALFPACLISRSRSNPVPGPRHSVRHLVLVVGKYRLYRLSLRVCVCVCVGVCV